MKFIESKERESSILDEHEKPIVVKETTEYVLKARTKDFDNPYGCLWQKPDCPGTPVRIVWSRARPFFFCKCGFDTSSPSKQIYELADSFGLLDKKE